MLSRVFAHPQPAGCVRRAVPAANNYIQSTQTIPSTSDLAGSTYGNPQIASGKVTTAKLADGAVTDAKVATANKDGLAGVPSLRTLGTGAQQAAAGNDSRLSDARPASSVNFGTATLSGTLPFANLPVGSTGTTVAAGNDPRLSDAWPASSVDFSTASLTGVVPATNLPSLPGDLARTVHAQVDFAADSSYDNVLTIPGIGTLSGDCPADGTGHVVLTPVDGAGVWMQSGATDSFASVNGGSPVTLLAFTSADDVATTAIVNVAGAFGTLFVAMHGDGSNCHVGAFAVYGG